MDMKIRLPAEFSFDLTCEFLQRSPREVLHRVGGKVITKLLSVDGSLVLFSITQRNNFLHIYFLNGKPSQQTQKAVADYVSEWFDLATDLKPFYAMASKDPLLKTLTKKYFGYRIVGQPDLFESLVWAVLGQQINVQFAYTLKKRLVENFGERLVWQGVDYFLFPTPGRLCMLHDSDLLPFQFSRQKSRYVLTLAHAFASGVLSKEKLIGLPLDEARAQLMQLKGVGNWTANYALMKSFRYPQALPLEDAALHNAIKKLLALRQKPTLPQIKKIFARYRGWEAYATLYLWKAS